MYRTPLYKTIRNLTIDDYSDLSWPLARQWVRHVGMPRLIATEAASEASGLLSSISGGIHRNEPELSNLLEAAREAIKAYTIAMMNDKWRRFDSRKLE